MENKQLILMLGDSLTQFWKWDELSSQARVANHGRAGDTTAGVWSRLKMALSLSPAIVFLQVGVNDLSQGISPEEICQTHQRIWEDLAKEAPYTKLLVCSLMPVREDSFDWFTETLTNEKVRAANRLLKEAADQKGLTFIDLYSQVADKDLALPEHMTLDGVHLTAAAYEVWLAILKNYL
jgi:lysophospholipase L1-like esterase